MSITERKLRSIIKSVIKENTEPTTPASVKIPYKYSPPKDKKNQYTMTLQHYVLIVEIPGVGERLLRARAERNVHGDRINFKKWMSYQAKRFGSGGKCEEIREDVFKFTLPGNAVPPEEFARRLELGLTRYLEELDEMEGGAFQVYGVDYKKLDKDYKKMLKRKKKK